MTAAVILAIFSVACILAAFVLVAIGLCQSSAEGDRQMGVDPLEDEVLAAQLRRRAR